MPSHTLSKPINDRSEPPSLEKPIDSRAQLATRAAFAILLVLLALWIASDFLTALAWAAVIAITTWPVYIRFATLISDDRSPGLAPLLFTGLTGLVLVVPIILTMQQIVQGSDAFVHWVTQLRQDGIPVPDWVAQLPIAGEYLDGWWQANLSNPRAVVEWLRGVNMESLTVWTSALGGELLHRLFLFLIMLMALFLVFREGEWLADRLLDTTDRLLGDPGEHLASRIAGAIRGTVNGIVSVAVADGAIIGTGYVLAGVPHPLFFVVLTIAFAMLPLGAWAAFAAAALVLLFHGGSPLAAAGVFGFGATVMLIGDNFIQPALVGRTTRVPFLLALVGIFGGLRTFGLIGLFLGPVIMTAVLTVLREWAGIKD
jgi:predicted PurR-regulated permease PerM